MIGVSFTIIWLQLIPSRPATWCNSQTTEIWHYAHLMVCIQYPLRNTSPDFCYVFPEHPVYTHTVYNVYIYTVSSQKIRESNLTEPSKSCENASRTVQLFCLFDSMQSGSLCMEKLTQISLVTYGYINLNMEIVDMHTALYSVNYCMNILNNHRKIDLFEVFGIAKHVEFLSILFLQYVTSHVWITKYC